MGWLIEFVYRMLSSPWAANWEEYTLEDDEFDEFTGPSE